MGDLGEERFTWLLRQRSIPYEGEEGLQKHITVHRRRPDFYAVPTGLPPFLAEVEGFKKSGPLQKARARVYATGPEQMLPRLRTAVQHGASQLKPYRNHGIPMIVVLDNSGRVGIALGVIELINLLGIQEIRLLIDLETGGRVSPPHMKGSEESFHVLTPKNNRHVSAVAVNLPKQGHQHIDPPEKERPMRLRVLHNPYAQIPFPLGIFNDPEDDHFGLFEGQWINIRTN